MSKLIATFFGVGYMRPAAGTWGSLAALPVAWALNELGGFWLVVAALVAAFFAGWWATEKFTAARADKDPSEVVIDEVVGQWIGLLPVFIGASHADVQTLDLWPGWVTAFLAFRLFDIWKPGPIGWADRRGDALGVILDDVIAGIAAALCVMLGAYLAHSVFAQ